MNSERVIVEVAMMPGVGLCFRTGGTIFPEFYAEDVFEVRDPVEGQGRRDIQLLHRGKAVAHGSVGYSGGMRQEYGFYGFDDEKIYKASQAQTDAERGLLGWERFFANGFKEGDRLLLQADPQFVLDRIRRRLSEGSAQVA